MKETVSIFFKKKLKRPWLVRAAREQFKRDVMIAYKYIWRTSTSKRKEVFNLNNNAGTETKGYNQPWVWIEIRDTNH